MVRSLCRGPTPRQRFSPIYGLELERTKGSKIARCPADAPRRPHTPGARLGNNWSDRARRDELARPLSPLVSVVATAREGDGCERELPTAAAENSWRRVRVKPFGRLLSVVARFGRQSSGRGTVQSGCTQYARPALGETQESRSRWEMQVALDGLACSATPPVPRHKTGRPC